MSKLEAMFNYQSQPEGGAYCYRRGLSDSMEILGNLAQFYEKSMKLPDGDAITESERHEHEVKTMGSVRALKYAIRDINKFWHKGKYSGVYPDDEGWLPY